jgi:uncharacterized membrane protein
MGKLYDMNLFVISKEMLVLLFTISIFLVGTMAGLFFAYSVSVVLALDTLSASVYTRVMQSVNDAILNVVFGIAFFGSVAVPVVSAMACIVRGGWTAQHGQLFIAGTAIYLVGTVAVTMAVHIPMNEYLATWSPTSPPDDWETVRTRWGVWNHVRTVAAVVSFVLCLAAFALYV